MWQFFMFWQGQELQDRPGECCKCVQGKYAIVIFNPRYNFRLKTMQTSLNVWNSFLLKINIYLDRITSVTFSYMTLFNVLNSSFYYPHHAIFNNQTRNTERLCSKWKKIWSMFINNVISIFPSIQYTYLNTFSSK